MKYQEWTHRIALHSLPLPPSHSPSFMQNASTTLTALKVETMTGRRKKDGANAGLIKRYTPFLPSFSGMTVPGLAAVATGFFNKDPIALAAGLQIAALGTIEMAKVQMESEGREPKVNANGMEIPLGVAEQLQMVQDSFKPIWFELLKNSMDPNFPHQVRPEDLALAKTLHPSDFLLVVALGKLRREITAKYQTCASYFNERRRSHMYGGQITAIIDEGLTDLHILETQANIVFGAPFPIPREELRYALKMRGGVDGGDGDLFQVRAMQVENSRIAFSLSPAWKNGDLQRIDASDLGLPEAPDDLTIFSAKLTPRASRLWQRFEAVEKHGPQSGQQP